MNEEEARAVMKAHGWTYAERRPKGVAKYVYAQRKHKGKLTDLYICPYSRLADFTEDELVAKLEQPPPAQKM